MFTGEATSNLGLPQWLGGDHPEWLNDMNPAFQKIDESIGELTGTANEASKLITEIIPIVTENTEKISALDTREESDRAYLQEQIDSLKNADVFIHGILDGLKVTDNELKATVKNIDDRLKEEEGTTAGFSSAAGNTIMDYYNRIKTQLENHVQDYTEHVAEFESHVDDWDTKYADLHTRLQDAEGNIATLDNRVIALEDWKSPFSQQVAELEEQFGVVNSDVVDLKERFKLLQDNVNVIDTSVHNLESKEAVQDARLDAIDTKIAELEGKGSASEEDLTALETKVNSNKTEIDALDARVGTLENTTAQQAGAISTAETNIEALQTTATNLQEQINNNKTSAENNISTLTERVGAHDTEIDSVQGDITDIQNILVHVPRMATMVSTGEYYMYGNGSSATKKTFTTLTEMVDTCKNKLVQLANENVLAGSNSFCFVSASYLNEITALIDDLGRVYSMMISQVAVTGYVSSLELQPGMMKPVINYPRLWLTDPSKTIATKICNHYNGRYIKDTVMPTHFITSLPLTGYHSIHEKIYPLIAGNTLLPRNYELTARWHIDAGAGAKQFMMTYSFSGEEFTREGA